MNLKNKIEFSNNLWVAEVSATHFNSSKESRVSENKTIEKLFKQFKKEQNES